jgi:tetratricopeptide (TPR) repeat protein
LNRARPRLARLLLFKIAELWHGRGMRFVFALLLSCCFAHAAMAEEDRASTRVPLAQPKIMTDTQKRSIELDQLFAKLHQPKLPDAENIEQKIWTLWNDSPTAELLLKQATAAMDDKAFDTSETMLDTLLESFPEYLEAVNKRATLYFNQKRFDDALADLDTVLEQEPRHFGALAARGFVFAAQKKYAPAADAFREALAVNPNMDGVAAALKQLQHDYPDI